MGSRQSGQDTQIPSRPKSVSESVSHAPHWGAISSYEPTIHALHEYGRLPQFREFNPPDDKN
jgi:hypothetical protein